MNKEEKKDRPEGLNDPDRAAYMIAWRDRHIEKQNALIRELQSGRIYAALDVYEKEGNGGVPPELLALTGNTLLQPHYSCGAVTWEMTQGIVDDVRRFLNNEPLKLQVSLQQYRLMTQE